MGPQGLPGSEGTKGDVGIAGTNGTAGTNGQNFYAVDATGKTLGPVLGSYGWQVDVLIDNSIWSLHTGSSLISSSISGSASYYSDASCAIPYMRIAIGNAISSQGIVVDYGQNDAWETTDKAYKVSGSQVSWTGKTIYSWYDLTSTSRICTAETDSYKSALALRYDLYPLAEVTKPTFTAPLTIVAK
jgi:hypothetical protein